MTDQRIRVIIDNDFSGDPDGLVQLAHHLLSPSVDIRAVTGLHLRPGDPFDPSDVTADFDGGGRPIRVYTRLDLRLLFEDLYSKLAAHAAAQAQARARPAAHSA